MFHAAAAMVAVVATHGVAPLQGVWDLHVERVDGPGMAEPWVQGYGGRDYQTLRVKGRAAILVRFWKSPGGTVITFGDTPGTVTCRFDDGWRGTGTYVLKGNTLTINFELDPEAMDRRVSRRTLEFVRSREAERFREDAQRVFNFGG